VVTDLRIGAIGFGLRGRLLSHAHRPGAGARVVALCDPSPAAGEAFRAEFGSDVTVDPELEPFLDRDLDAVFVLSPDDLHHPHASALLERDIAVYLEKPMAITTADCDDLLRLMRRRDGRLYVGHNMRHAPFVREMRRLILSGAIGTPQAAWCRHFVSTGGDYYFSDWHAERRRTTSLLLQKGAHDIDVLHWLMGSHTVRTVAMGDLMVYGANANRADAANPPIPWRERDTLLDRWPPTTIDRLHPTIDVEDLSMMLMTLENGTFASYQQSHFTPDYFREYTVIGDAGRIENAGNGGEGTEIRLWQTRTDSWAPHAALRFPIPVAKGGHGGADPAIVTEFLDYVRHGGATETSPIAARHAVAAGCAAAHSLRHGSIPVDIPSLPAGIS
jgi:predicted dehydrogenase